jgi:dimeric dUTPase (all-alpha-NTP-PPase superfamily)
MIEKTRVMLSMQDDMNRHVDADWLSREREWYRAIWIECAELMEHYGGWKWWKHGQPDYAQAMLEIVDIWHFGLSMRIDSCRDYRRIATEIAEEWGTPRAALPFLEEVEYLAAAALGEQRFAVASVRLLLDCIGHSFDELYRAYVGKNVLNVFRQDHGYKSGEYVKIWGGREDNEILTELIAGLDSDSPEFRRAIYRSLHAEYAKLNPA